MNMLGTFLTDAERQADIAHEGYEAIGAAVESVRYAAPEARAEKLERLLTVAARAYDQYREAALTGGER